MSEELPVEAVVDSETAGLTPTQQDAIRLLVEGSNITAAATSVGVTRRTLHRWLKDDAYFRAAYNAWQQEVMASARARLLRMTDDALSAVEGAVKRGDARSGMALLRSLGLLQPPTPESINPEELRRQMEMDNYEQRIAAALRKHALDDQVYRKPWLKVQP